MSLSLQYARVSGRLGVAEAAAERAPSSGRRHTMSMRAFTAGTTRWAPTSSNGASGGATAAATNANDATTAAAAPRPSPAKEAASARHFSTAQKTKSAPAATKRPHVTPHVTPPPAAAAPVAPAPSPLSLRTVHSQLQLHIKHGATAKAEDLWARMVASGQKPETETYRHLLCVYLAAREGARSRLPPALRDELSAAGLKFSAADYDALITVAHKHNKTNEISALAQQAKAAGLLRNLRADVQAVVASVQGGGKQKQNAATAPQSHSHRTGSASSPAIPSATDLEESAASSTPTPAAITAKLADLLSRATKLQAALAAETDGVARSKLLQSQRELVAEAEQHWAMGLRMACVGPRDTLAMMHTMAAAGKHERMCDVMLDAARLERSATQLVERIDAACLKALFDALYSARERPGIESVIDRAYQFFLLRYGAQPEAKLGPYKPVLYSYFKCLSRVRDQQLIREVLDLPAVYKADHADLFALVWRAIESAGATDFASEAAELVKQMSEARCPLTSDQAGVWLSAQNAEGADTVWRLMTEQGLTKTAMHYAQLMQTYLESEDPARVAKVEDLYAELLESELQLTAPLFEALVGTARDLDLDPIAERWISRAREKGFQVNRALLSPRQKWTPEEQEPTNEGAAQQADKDKSLDASTAPEAAGTRAPSLLSMHRASLATADLRASAAKSAARHDSGVLSEEQPSGRKMLTDRQVFTRQRRDQAVIDQQRTLMRESLKKHHVLNLFSAVAAAEAETPAATEAAAAESAPAPAAASDNPAASPATVSSTSSDDLVSSSEFRRGLEAMLDVQNEALLQFPTAASAVVRVEMLRKTEFKNLQIKAGKSVDRVLGLLRSADAGGAAIPCSSYDWLSILQCCDSLYLWDKALPAFQLMIQLHINATAREAVSQPPLDAPAAARPSKSDSVRAEREAELDARDPNPFPKVSSSTFPDSLLSQRMLSCVLQMALHHEPLQAGDHVLRYFNYLRRARYPINAECAALVLRAYANAMPRRVLGQHDEASRAALTQARSRYDALSKLPWIATDDQRGPTKSMLAGGMLGIYVRQRDHVAFEDLWAQVTKQGQHLTPLLVQRRFEQIEQRVEELMMEEYQLNRVSESVGTKSAGVEARLANTTSIAIEHLRSDAKDLWSKATAAPNSLLDKNVVQCMLMVASRLRDIPLQLEIADTALALEKKLIPPPRMRKVVAETDAADGEQREVGANASAPPPVSWELDPDAPPPAGPVLLGTLSLTTLIHNLSEDRAPWQHVELVASLYEGHQQRYQKAVEQGHWSAASTLMLNDAIVAAYQRFLQRSMFFTHASEHDSKLHASKKEANPRFFLAQMTIASMQGDVEMARTVVTRMEEARVPYGRSAFTSHLGACIDSGDWAEAERVWLKALSLSLPLDSYAYMRLMQVYLTAGAVHLAKIDALLEEMARKAITLAPMDYARLFQSCFDLRNATVIRVLHAQAQRDGAWLQLPTSAKRQALTVESWRSLSPPRLSRSMRRRVSRDLDLIKWNIQVPKTDAERAQEAAQKVTDEAAKQAAKGRPVTKAVKAEIRKSIREKQSAKLERVRAEAAAATDRRRLLYSGGVRGGRGVLTPHAYPKVRIPAVLRPKVAKKSAVAEQRERAGIMLRKYGPRLPRYPSLHVPAKPRPTGFFGRIAAAVSDVRDSIGAWLSEFRRQAFPRESETDELWEPKQKVVVTVESDTLAKPKHSSLHSRITRPYTRKTMLKARKRNK